MTGRAIEDQAAAAREQQILAVWQSNAEPWTRAVRGQSIASRRLVTDAAIVQAVIERRPRSVIDLGCGEGWLVRRLTAEGIATLGVDAVPALVESAAAAGGGRFVTADYAAIAAGGLNERADAVVCNFSLFGAASVDRLLQAMPSLLLPAGVAIIQTVHPGSVDGAAACTDGWREGSWAGCGEGFGAPAPWYFRTIEGWLASFAAAGLGVPTMREPLHPHSGQPASVIFVLQQTVTP
jgi:2-polyprenyl-3-methyl-5-hydroxy-6-metoxy-1,4-benzoquinol methylase